MLLKFTGNAQKNPIFVNPQHVVYLSPGPKHPDTTVIHFSTHDHGAYVVEGDILEVAMEIDKALKMINGIATNG